MGIYHKHVIGGVIAIAMLVAGVLCVTFSTVTQSIPLLLLAITTVIAIVSSYKKIYLGNYKLKLFTLVVILYLLLRAYFSPVYDLARQDMFLILSGAMLYCINGVFVPSKIVRKWTTLAFVIIMVLNLLNWIPAVDHFHDITLDYAVGERKTGLFHHRNFFGNFMFMMACLCLSLALLGNDKSKLFRSICGILGACAATSVILSTARSSFLALAVGVFVLIVCWVIAESRASGKKHLGLKMILGFGIILVTVFGGIVGAKFVLNERSRGLVESDSRHKYFAISVEQIPDAPLLGSGSRSVEYKSYEYWPMEMFRVLSDYRFVHNEYLQAITDYGVIGLLLLLATFFWHIINGFILVYNRSAERKTEQLAYVVAGLSILIGLAVNMLFSFPMHGYVNLMLIVFAATMLLGETSSTNEEKKSPYVFKPLVILACSGVMICSCVVGVPEMMAGRAFWKQKIVSDDLFWELDEETSDKWELTLREVIKTSPSYARYNRLGEISFAKGEYEEAFQYYQMSKERHPYSPTSCISLARLYIKTGQYRKAEEEFAEVEYLVKNREPLFNYYRNLADFYLGWSQVENQSQADLLRKARQACQMSVKKNDGWINDNLRKTIARVLLACYYDELQREEYDAAYQTFDEFVLACKPMTVKSEEEGIIFLMYAKEMLKHADFAWNKGLMSRAAKNTHNAYYQYHRYKHFMQGEVNQEWTNEVHQIKLALDMFKDAGVEYNKK